MNAIQPHLWFVHIGSGNDLLSSLGNKSLPELMLAQIYMIYVAIYGVIGPQRVKVICVQQLHVRGIDN